MRKFDITLTVVIAGVLITSGAGCSTLRTPTYSDFPKGIQQLINEKTTELTSDGGMYIVGRVTMSDGAHISNGKDIKINIKHRGTDKHLPVYDGGWFVVDHILKPSRSDYIRPTKVILRAFGYDPIDVSIAPTDGEVTYLGFVMHKTTRGKLSKIAGTVVNEQNEPISGAKVKLLFPLSYRPDYGVPRMSKETGPDGKYSFKNLSTAEHKLLVTSPDYTYSSFHITPPSGGTKTENVILYKNQKVVIDYVYQADGSRDFNSGAVEVGTIEWVHGTGGVDFSDGGVEDYERGSLRDIELRQKENRLYFYVTYVNGRNGFYDAGVADFESVTEAAETGYSSCQKPCEVGHVYVVRTYEDNYAKFVVRSYKEL